MCPEVSLLSVNRLWPSSDAIVGGATENTGTWAFPSSFPFQDGSLAVVGVLWAEFRLRHSLEGKNQTSYHNSGV